MSKISESTVRFAVEKGYFTCMNDVFKLDLSTIDKLTYIALTRYADSNNKAWPKYDTLAKDVSCSRKRVILAVSKLVECKLVVKHERKNRTNIYLVYPPEYYCQPLKNQFENNYAEPLRGVAESPQVSGGVSFVHPCGETETLRENSEVSPEHPWSKAETPPGCPQVPSGVSPGHPISTKISTRENSSSTNQEIQSERETKTKKPGEKDVNAVLKAFKGKGVLVQNSVIEDFLKSCSVKEIKGAIQCTDFNASRNPIAVIHKLLKTGSYVMPVERELSQLPQDQPKEPEDEEVVREMIKTAKEGLMNKIQVPAN